MPGSNMEPPYYPIIYVRGYAGSQAAVEDTVADPYMGFNLGATKIRQRWEGDLERLYFESPLVRLMKDYGYRDVYEGGEEMPIGFDVQARSVFIYRYYDQVSRELGMGERPEIEDYALGLGRLIGRVRDRICGDDETARKAFRLYLVAHSMGGLICRCFLQNDTLGSTEEEKGALAAARGMVDKVFTYATPHNGIDVQLIGNLPAFFSRNNVNNFNRDRMRKYLGLSGEPENVATLDGDFDPERFFCLVGTNHTDYEAGGGWSRRAVGPMSDGLVRIVNAVVSGEKNGRIRHAPRAFVHRAHSGDYGIVNSESGYQNLKRFFFGDVRVDGILEIEDLTLPPRVAKAYQDGKRVRASYHFEVVVSVRGERWDLHRRIQTENSAIFRTFDEMFPKDGADGRARHPHLFSTFLSTQSRVKKARRSLGFSIDLTVQVPEYEIENRLWFDDHFSGGYLYRDKINLEAIPPPRDEDVWQMRYGSDRRTPNRAGQSVEGKPVEDGLEFRIPIEQKTKPGMKATLVIRARHWNQ